jgi:hypothetical protein
MWNCSAQDASICTKNALKTVLMRIPSRQYIV